MRLPDLAAEPTSGVGTRFPPGLMHAAASLYYNHDVTQAEVAQRLGVSRPTVSRLLTEARRQGIVRIEVVEPLDVEGSRLAERTATALGLSGVYLSAFNPTTFIGAALAPALSTALREVGVSAGDVLLVSSGRTVYEAAQAELPQLPGVTVVPTIGGQDEPEPWYQTNEIIRQVALRTGGTPKFLNAPALPGPDLYDVLIHDPSTRRIIELWRNAQCAVLGVGAPPLLRESLPRFIQPDPAALRDAVGDVCSRFYDKDGTPVAFPGIERMLATPLDVLKNITASIAVAVGQAKVGGIIAGAKAGYFNHLVTDPATAAGVLAELP